MVQFGIRGHDLGGKQKFSDFVEKVKKNNIENIQLAFKKAISDIDFSYGNLNYGLTNFIKNNFEKNNIHISVLGCYINPVNPDTIARQKDIDSFIEHLKYAKMINADMVGTETGRYDSNFNIVPYTYTEGCYQILVESMKKIIDAAEKLGVMVGVEGVADHTLYCPEIMKRFLDDINSPNLTVIFDPVNLISIDNYLKQVDLIDKAMNLYGDKIGVIHIKDFNVSDETIKYAQIGQGLFNYKHLFKHLIEKKPYITLLIEDSNEQRYHEDCNFLNRIYKEVLNMQ